MTLHHYRPFQYPSTRRSFPEYREQMDQLPVEDVGLHSPSLPIIDSRKDSGFFFRQLAEERNCILRHTKQAARNHRVSVFGDERKPESRGFQTQLWSVFNPS